MNDSSEASPAMARRMEPTVYLPFGQRAKGSGKMLSLHKLLTFGNAQTGVAMHSLNRRFLGLNAERGDQLGQLLDVNHNQNSFAIILRKITLIGQ